MSVNILMNNYLYQSMQTKQTCEMIQQKITQNVAESSDYKVSLLESTVERIFALRAFLFVKLKKKNCVTIHRVSCEKLLMGISISKFLLIPTFREIQTERALCIHQKL